MVAGLLDKGWALFPPEAALAHWVTHARLAALERIADPDQQARWLQCQGTWFVGVDCLPNAPDGSVPGGAPLTGTALDAAQTLYGALPLHKAQVSVTYPGYPKPRKDEGQGAFRYRLTRDAAHVDGLHASGAQRQRHLIERHAYILGLPLNDHSADASPLVVWQGSHHIMRAAFEKALGDLPERQWETVDLTDIYQSARRKVFDTCTRLTLPAKPGQATLLHRHTLHGVAPWGDAATAPPEGRMIAYFRPDFPDHTRDWLSRP